MKIRFLIIGVLLVTVLALMTVPVSAANSGTTALTGNVQSFVSITVSPATIGPLTLDPAASPATNSALDITISANKASTVSVKDNTGRSTKQGYMGNYTTSYVASPLDTALASSLQLTASSTCVPGASGTITPVVIASPITSAVSMFTTTGVLHNADCPANGFSQAVAETDPVLPGSNTYRMDLEFDIAAN